MKNPTRLRLAGSLLVVALGAAACGGSSTPSGNSSPTSSTPGATGVTTGIVSANGSEPQNPLLPGNTNETGGGKIMQLLFRGLVVYDATGKTVNAVAKDIKTSDSKTYTVTLNDGEKFSDGEAITAKTFVDSWNFAALGTNAQLNAFFFDPIAGYADVHPDAPADAPKDATPPPPTAQTMSGLKVVDDKTFTITLSAADSSFPQRLGYTAFFPLPAKALADPKTYGESPIGNGPYMLKGKWEHKVQFKTVPNPMYTGADKPQNGGITLKFYDKLDAAYADLQADNLDVLDALPSAAIATYKTDLGDRALNTPAGIFQSFTFPLYQKDFQGPNAAKVRQAISMAIDRKSITDAPTIFNGTRIPATDLSSPVVAGYSKTVCGDLCTFNPDKAKALYKESGGLPGNAMSIAYNADGGHADWVDAVCNSIKNTLGVKCTGNPSPLFADFRKTVTAKQETSAFRTGWQMDYPALENFMIPLYKTGAGSNDGGYSNPAVDKLLAEGSAAPSAEAGIAKFQEAEKLVLQDMPAIPLWNSNATGGFSTKVQNVKFDVFSVPLYYEITKK